jgi:HEAT repeat protein
MEPIATAGRDSPLAVVRARELLATAEDRDTVFITLLRAARARARYAGLLTVQGGAAIGRLALAETGLDTAAIHNVLIPLDAVSPFRAVTHNQQPHIGPLVSGDPGIDAMVMRLGGSMPPSALLLPIVLRDRVVAVVIAHRVHSDLKLVDVTELLPLAAGAADALGRLIVKHKSAGYRTPASAAPIVEVADDKIDTKKIARTNADWSAPGSRQSVPSLPIPTEPEVAAAPAKPIGHLMDSIEASVEGGADAAITEAVERSQETLGELAKRFPGTLRVERFAVTGRPLRAAQYGGLLELLVRLGAAAGEVIIDRMSSPQRDIRFYATVCAAELRPRNAVFALVERLFDQDYGVRSMAVEALAGYPVADMSHALPRARRALHSSDPETVAAAAAAVVQLGDIDSIDDLIGAVERGDRGAEHARKALVSLTAQDFGLSQRKWRKWFEAARRRHRIEWLIDGLGHKDDAIREAAINDLRRLTGEYFGYHHDLPRREREVGAERWSSWWRETGMRRFVHREDERSRPTGVLPVRKD